MSRVWAGMVRGRVRYLALPAWAQWGLAGLLVALATCWPLDGGFPEGVPVWWLQLPGMAWVAHLCLRSASPAAAARGAAVFGGVWLTATTWWLYVAMHTYGGLPAVLTMLAVLALALALGGYYTLAMYAVRRSAAANVWVWPLQFAAWWLMAELARANWLTGFGWGAVGYAHTEGPLAALAPWIGMHGIGAVAVWIAASFAAALYWRRWAGMLPALALLLALWTLPRAEFTHATGSIPVALLQGNIAQDQKFEAGSGVPQALRWYAAQLQAEQQVLVVAPETAIPLVPMDLPVGYWEQLHQRRLADGGAALVGIPMGDAVSGYTNSVLGLGLGPDYRYDKHHLVPFGEFIPPWFKWFTQLMKIPLGDFLRGGLGQPSFVWRGQRRAPNICYEDLDGEELGRRFLVADTAPNIFVNISNLGWFGDTVVLDQHLQISRMRALEFQRPFLRATNTGSTQILDYQAHTQAQLARFTRGVLHGSVQGRAGITPFAWWIGRFGLWPYWLLAGVLLLLGRRAKAIAAAAAHSAHAGS